MESEERAKEREKRLILKKLLTHRVMVTRIINFF